MSKGRKYGIGLGVVIALLFVTDLLVGLVAIPVPDVFHIFLGGEGGKASWRFIVWEAHLLQAMTALPCRSALAVCGSMLQIAFKNPLAGPSILGISPGASLGMTFVILLFGGNISADIFSLSGFLSVSAGASVGAMLIMGLILFFSTLLKSNVTLLIIDIMMGYVASPAITLLSFFATAERVQSYMVRGLDNFGDILLQQVPAFASVTVAGLSGSLLLIKPLSALPLDERYAENLGASIVRAYNQLLITTDLLTVITTAFCGPVAFIGLAVPHIARMMLRTVNHNPSLPATVLSGGAVVLFRNLICVLPGGVGTIPSNVVTPIVGAPVTIYVIVSQRNP